MFEWLKELLLWVPQHLWDLMLDGLASVIEALPVPDWLSSLSSWGAGMPSAVGFVLHAMKVPEGLAMLFSAYVIRFLIRRIPVIG